MYMVAALHTQNTNMALSSRYAGKTMPVLVAGLAFIFNIFNVLFSSSMLIVIAGI